MDVSNACLIGIDWGTSSLRAFLIGTRGEVLDQLTTSKGIMHIPDKDFDVVLTRLIDPWIHDKRLPIIASGMITSRNGWLETPYLSVPTDTDQLAAELQPIHMANRSIIHFITGLTVDHRGAPDVMRGEEAQIAGAVEAGLADGICVMPGTHSKWITVVDKRIVDFETFMTGEIFEALRSHTILGTLIENGDFSENAFRDGVTAGFDAGSKLLHTLFHVRTLPLFEKIDKTKVADYLSGMLIGAEITGALFNQNINGPVTIVGRDDLADRYATALKMLEIRSIRESEDIVVGGHFAIAAAARLI